MVTHYEMNIANEIQIHDPIGNATLIGGQAIRLGPSPNFHPPNISGYHLYNYSTLIETFVTTTSP